MPMRSVPFKLVALLGMQDKAFPRVDTYLSFDRLAHDKNSVVIAQGARKTVIYS